MSSTMVAGSAPRRRFLLGGNRRPWLLGLFGVLVALLTWWTATAGAVTVFRIVYFNQTGIEDFEDFPSRSLEASDTPARLRVVANGSSDALSHTIAQRIEQIVSVNDSVAFLVLRDNKVLFERYYDGWTRSTPSQSFSMGKSFLSMLIGAAIDDGYIDSVADPITKYVPQLARGGFEDVTIEDLLQMRSGSNYVENENPLGIHARFTYTPELKAEVLKLRVEDATHPWSYKSGDTAILTLILDRALAPKTVTDYTQEVLWSPLGMESPGLWMISDDGLEKTWCCMAATARDYAKLGRLYLQLGRFRGEQIIPRSWVSASVESGFTGESVLNDHHKMMGVWSYNYHWWLVSQEDQDFMASGHAGQFVYVNPTTNTVVVRLGKSQGNLMQSEWLDLFRWIASSETSS